jgi:hypothetical protein
MTDPRDTAAGPLAIDDASIPVLTERILAPGRGDQPPLSTAAAAQGLTTGLEVPAHSPPSAAVEPAEPVAAESAGARKMPPGAPAGDEDASARAVADAAALPVGKPRAAAAEERFASAAAELDAAASPFGEPRAAAAQQPAAADATSSIRIGAPSAGLLGATAARLAERIPPADDTTAEDARLAALQEAVIARVSARLPQTIDATLRALTQAEMERASARIAEQARADLQASLRDLVAQALREELGGAKQ